MTEKEQRAEFLETLNRVVAGMLAAGDGQRMSQQDLTKLAVSLTVELLDAVDQVYDVD